MKSKSIILKEKDMVRLVKLSFAILTLFFLVWGGSVMMTYAEDPKKMEQYIAIDNVCAWPTLTLMPDGAIIATIFNQPTHGKWEGDAECWASEDNGRIWYRRGVPALHEPGTNRKLFAAGLARDGVLIVIASGITKCPPKRQPGGFGDTISNDFAHSYPEGTKFLAPWVCRSIDGGRTWERSGVVHAPSGRSLESIIPWGDVVRLNDGSLGVSFYGWCPPESAYFYRSKDNGRTWNFQSIIQDNINETALLALDNGRLLAAARTLRDEHLELLISDDEGNTWTKRGPLTSGWQHPAHLLKLADGRILLEYGIRAQGIGFRGLGVRVSQDRGESWSAPRVLVNFEGPTDGGYPSSVQTKDGIIVTAYYCNWLKFHQRYHMGVIRWRLDE